MQRRSFRRLATTLAALAVAGLSADRAGAHEEGVLRLASARVRAGQTLMVNGESFSRSTSFRLVLKGALREYELTSVETDAQGAFGLQLPIPAEVEPGSYRLLAVAPNGDDAAAVDLEIEAPAHAGTPAERETEAARSPLASAEPLVFERSWSGVEWFAIGVLLGAALVGGVFWLRVAGVRGNGGA